MIFRIIFHIGFMFLSLQFNAVKCTCIWSSANSLDCYIVANCTSSGISISIKGTDFPKSTSSDAFLSNTGDASIPTGCEITMSTTQATEYSGAFSTNACVMDLSSGFTKASVMMSNIYLKYDGVGNTATEDIQASIVCTVGPIEINQGYAEASISFETADVINAEDHIDYSIPWTDTSLKFYDANNPNTELNSLTLNSNSPQICAKITTTDTGIEDFNIKKLRFSASMTNHVTDEYIDIIDAGCTDTGYGSMFEFPSLASGATCTSTLKEQCLKQRVVCFDPFGFQNKNSLYVIATLKRLQSGKTTPVPGVLETCSSGDGIGKKRRSSEQNDESVMISGVLKVFQDDDHIVKTVYESRPCDTRTHIIVITGLGGLLIALLVFAVYMLAIITKKSK